MAWQMMNRLRCTYTELQDQPFMETEVFMAFATGEAQAERTLREANK